MKHWTRKAFTLIEMLVVVVVIAILAGIVFRMISIISRHGDRAASIARIQRVANAVEGFHTEYGQYPPVPFYEGTTQPFRYEFAHANGMAPSIALALAGNPSVEWQDARVFTFGLMAFLIDRYRLAQSGYDELFVINQWTEYNDYSDALSARDAASISQWAPQLDGIVSGDTAGRSYGSGGQAFTNMYRTVRDAWHRELRYASPPPHQQYRIWTQEPGTRREISSGNWDN